MHYDDGADRPRREPPGGGPAVLQNAGLIEGAYFKRLGEILAKVVRRAKLQRLAVSHHRFKRLRRVRPRELPGIRFAPRNHWYGSFIPRKIRINVPHLSRFRFRLFGGGMSGVTLLPEEFEGAQEKLRAKLPAHHAVPLIDQNRKIAVGLDPLRIGVTDDRFGRGPNHQRFVKLFATTVRYDSKLRRKPCHV